MNSLLAQVLKYFFFHTQVPKELFWNFLFTKVSRNFIIYTLLAQRLLFKFFPYKIFQGFLYEWFACTNFKRSRFRYSKFLSMNLLVKIWKNFFLNIYLYKFQRISFQIYWQLIATMLSLLLDPKWGGTRTYRAPLGNSHKLRKHCFGNFRYLHLLHKQP